MTQPEAGVVVDPEPMRAAVAAVFSADGATTADARIVAEHLVDSDLCDHPSHGVFRVTEYHQACSTGQIDPRGTPRIVRDDETTIVVDGGRGFGHIAARFTADAAIERAAEHGVCVATLANGSHVGRLGDHVEHVAEHGHIGIMMANDSGANQVVAPHGGADGRLATNPIAFGVPRSHPPHLVLDMATSAISHGKATVQARRDGGEGHVSGLLEPFGGYKGFGLGVVVEVFAGILTGAGFSGPTPGPDHQGVCLIVVNPARFGDQGSLAESVDQLVDWVKQSPATGSQPVRVPGERGHASRERTTEIRIDPVTWGELLEVFAETGVAAPPHRPFSS